MGTIAQKLEYLNDTRLLLKDNINKINNVLDDNSTFRSYPQELFNGYLDILNNGTDTLWNNLEKVSASGEEATLENVETAPMKMVLNGNTSQDTTGKNLLDTNNISYSSTSTSLTINSNENGEITINGEHFANVTLKSSLSTPLSGTYTLIFKKISGNISNNNINFRYAIGNAENGSAASPNGRLLTNIFNGDSNIVVSTGNINDTMEKFHIYFNAGATFNNYKFVIYLVEGTYTSENIPSYEPYTGGQPSPSPDYPQEVKVVTGENVVSVSGKNLFTTDYLTSNNFTTYAKLSDNSFSFTATGTWKKATYNVPCKPNTDYYFNINSASSMYIQIKGVQTGTQLLSKYSAYLISFNSGENTELEINIGLGGNSIASDTISDIQLEEGTTKTDFVPFSKTDYPLSLGTLELCKIGTYQDYLYKNNGKWYVHKAIKKVVFNGTENWSLQSINDYGIANFQRGASITDYVLGTPNLSFNNYFSPQTTLIAETQKVGYFLNTSRAFFARFDSSVASTATEFKNWLNTHNMILYYALATPTEEEITNTTLIEQLEAIANAKSVKDKTYITQTNDDLPFILDVQAIKEYEVN